ncbi:hypothetical protein N431DRAFT_426520 [Stipitochalara longipes BDJ]|nr:hypothetical protein N431DRAFT_426520 [Stipitochalara longipes BDJ]
MDSELHSPVSPHSTAPPQKTTQQTQGASVGLPSTGPLHYKSPAIVYKGESQNQGPKPQAVALSSWQSFALGVLAFSSVVTMGLAIGVLAMAVKLGQTVESMPFDGGTVHMLRVDNSEL